MGDLCREPLITSKYAGILTFTFLGISLQKAICQLFANSWNSQIPEPRATRDRYRVRVHFSQTGMGRRLSSNQGVSRDFCRCRLLKCVSSLMDGVSHIALFSDS
jgi:hypothetical protein